MKRLLGMRFEKNHGHREKCHARRSLPRCLATAASKITRIGPNEWAWRKRNDPTKIQPEKGCLTCWAINRDGEISQQSRSRKQDTPAGRASLAKMQHVRVARTKAKGRSTDQLSLFPYIPTFYTDTSDYSGFFFFLILIHFPFYHFLLSFKW